MPKDGASLGRVHKIASRERAPHHTVYPDAFKGRSGLIKPTQAEREREIRRAIEHVFHVHFTITYLFYRSNEGWPEIMYDEEYSLGEYVRRQGS